MLSFHDFLMNIEHLIELNKNHYLLRISLVLCQDNKLNNNVRYFFKGQGEKHRLRSSYGEYFQRRDLEKEPHFIKFFILTEHYN